MPAPTTAVPTVTAHPGVFVQKKARDGREQRFCAPLQMPSAIHSQVPVITPMNVTVTAVPVAVDPAGSRPMTPTTPSSTHTVHNPYSVASNTDEFDAFEQITPTSGSMSSVDERMAALQQPQVSPSPSPLSPYGPAYGPPVSPTGHMVGGFGMPQYPRYTVPSFPHAAPSPYGVPAYPTMPTAVPVLPGYARMMAGTPTSMDGVIGYPSSPVVSAAHMHMVGAYGLPVSGPTTPTTPVAMHAAPVAAFDGSAPVASAAPVAANAVGDNEAKKAKRRRKRRAQEENTAVDAIRYKTKLCKNWQTTNRCPYGPRCLFAHGGRELRTCDTNTDAIVLASAMAQPESAFYSVGRFPNFVPVPRDLLGGEEAALMADNVMLPAVVETQQA